MIRKFFITVISVVLVASVCAVPVHASDGGHFSGTFPDSDDSHSNADSPNFDGFITDMIDNTYGYALGVRDMYQNALDYLLGKKKFVDFVSDGFRIATENQLDFLFDTLRSINENDMTPLDIVKLVVNSLNGYISNNGGNISVFPVSGTRISIPGGGYIEFSFPERLPFQPGVFDIGYSIYSSNNILVSEGTNSTYSKPPEGVAPYSNIRAGSYQLDISSTQLNIMFDSYYDGPSSAPVHRSTFITIPWVIGDGDFENITETSDVDGLSDDDLVKYMKDIIKNLDSTYPDLSTLEGKLQEIINLLGKLQNGNCSCNELAEAVYALLAYLENNGNSNNDLRDLLFELKNLLKYDMDLDPIKNRLDDIYDVLSDISFKLDEDTTAEQVENDILDSYEQFKKKVEDKFQITTIKRSINNFSSSVFGKVAFENDSASGRLMVASVYGDGSRSASDFFYPLSLKFEYEGRTYDLFEWSGFIPATTMSTFRSFIRFIIWITFLIGLFRSLPGIIGGFGAVTAPIDREIAHEYKKSHED